MTQTTSDKELAKLATAVSNMTTKENARKEGNVEGWSFLENPEIKESGFKAAAYKNNRTGKIAIVYGGSDDIKDWLIDDTAIALNKIVPQATEAINYYKAITSKYHEDEVNVTGHSLGGALTDFVAYYAATTLGDNKTQFITFNAPGVVGVKFYYGDRLYTVDTYGGILANVKEYRINGDPIGGYGIKLGVDICLNHIISISVNDVLSVKIFKKTNSLINMASGKTLDAVANILGHTMEEYTNKQRWNQSGRVNGICNNPVNVNMKDWLMYLLGTKTDWGLAWDGFDTTKPFGRAESIESPIILDLNGDGIVTTNVKDNYVNFDLDGNSFAERTGWIKNSDGFLVRDINVNGIIDSGREMFGNNTILKSGKKASDGYSALGEFDGNGDYKIDDSDAIYNELKIWKDGNSNGMTDKDELFALKDLGIKYLNLRSSREYRKDSAGNTVYGSSTFVREDGTTGTTADIFFVRDTVNSVVPTNRNIEYSDEIKSLPNVSSMGNVVDLHQAMADDSSGELIELVKQFVNANSAIKGELVDKILAKWTKIEYPANAFRGNADKQELSIMEKLFGAYFGSSAASNPGANAAGILGKQYLDVKKFICNTMIFDLYWKDVSKNINLSFDFHNNVVSIDMSKIKTLLSSAISEGNQVKSIDILNVALQSVHKIKGDFVIKLDRKFSDYCLNLGSEYVFLVEGFLKYELLATDKQNHVRASYYIDKDKENKGFAIRGNSKGNSLTGFDGNDVIYGGEGNDNIEGRNGSDVYVWEKGDGNDIINNHEDNLAHSKDILKLCGLVESDVILAQDKDDIIIKIKDTGEKIRVSSWFKSNLNKGLDIKFSNGALWSSEHITETAASYGTNNEEYFCGSNNHDDKMYGYGGNDQFAGAGGNDKIYGGYGDDLLHGQNGDDFLFGEEGEDCLKGEEGNDVLDGGQGNDILMGGSGNDVLKGGLGNDSLNGDAGNDIYVWTKGDGNDTISTSGNSVCSGDDMLIMQEIAQAMVEFSMSGDDLVCTYTPTNEYVTIKNWGIGSQYQLSSIECSDGKLFPDYINQKLKLG